MEKKSKTHKTKYIRITPKKTTFSNSKDLKNRTKWDVHWLKQSSNHTKAQKRRLNCMLRTLNTVKSPIIPHSLNCPQYNNIQNLYILMMIKPLLPTCIQLGHILSIRHQIVKTQMIN